MTDSAFRRLVQPSLFVAACILILAPHAQAQAASKSAPAKEAPLPAFDIASIKPHKDEGMRMMIGVRTTPDGFSASGAHLDMLLRLAFGVSRDRFLNLPAWATTSRFDIDAKVAPEDAPKLKSLDPHQRSAMMIPVFEERFGLKFHHEIRELPVYALVVEKGGPKLKEAQAGEASAAAPPLKSGSDGVPPPGQPQIMMRLRSQGMMLEAHSATIATLTRIISQQLDGTVVDKTGLTGKYDFTLNFTPEEGASPMARMPGASRRPMVVRNRRTRRPHRCSPPCRSSSGLNSRHTKKPSM